MHNPQRAGHGVAAHVHQARFSSMHTAPGVRTVVVWPSPSIAYDIAYELVQITAHVRLCR